MLFETDDHEVDCRPRPRSSHCAWCFEVITCLDERQAEWTLFEADDNARDRSNEFRPLVQQGWQQAEWMLFKADDQEVDDQVGEELRG